MKKREMRRGSSEEKREIKRVIIAGWHHDSNKGDAAILRSLIEILQMNDCRVAVYLQIPPNSRWWKSALKHNSIDPGDPDALAPLLYLRPFSLRFLQYIWAGYVFFRFILLLISPAIVAYLLTKKERETLDAFQNCALVIGKGGHYIYHLGGLSGFFALCTNLAPFLLALRLRKPFVFAGISVGPFRNTVARLVTKFVLKHARVITVREKTSFDILQQMGHFRNLSVSTDLAFLLSVASPCHSHIPAIRSKRILIIPRALFPADPHKTKYNAYIRVLASVADHLSLTHKIMFATTARDVLGGEDDMQAIFDIVNLMKGRNPVEIVASDLDPVALIEIFAQQDLIIGTRLHSVIFAIMAERPFVAISYFGSKMNIVRDVELGDLLVDINNLDEELIISKIIAVLSDLERWESLVKTAKQKAQTMAMNDAAIRECIDLLEKI